MLDPDCLDLGLDRDPHANEDGSARDWLWIIGAVLASYALAFGAGYWAGQP